MNGYTAMAFFDELHKIAADAEEEADKAKRIALLGGAGALGGTIAIPLAGQAAQAAAAREAAMEGGEELVGRLSKASPVPIVRDPRGGMGAYMSRRASKMMGMGDEAKILLPHGKGAGGVLAHEMGHAQFDKGLGGKLTQNIPARIAFGLSSLASPVAGAAAGYGIEDPRIGLGVAAGVPLAIAAPTLISEGVASFKGMRNLRRAGASPEQLRRAGKTLRRAFGTYAGKSLMDTGLGVGGYGVGRYVRKSSEPEVEAATEA